MKRRNAVAKRRGERKCLAMTLARIARKQPTKNSEGKHMSNGIAPKLWKSFDYGVCKTAAAAFHAVQFFNSFRPNPSFTPRWSDNPLLKSWRKSLTTP